MTFAHIIFICICFLALGTAAASGGEQAASGNGESGGSFWQKGMRWASEKTRSGVNWTKEHPKLATGAAAGAALLLGAGIYGTTKLVQAKSNKHSYTRLVSDLPAVTSAGFRGLNWADPRDNYAHDAVVPTGLSSADSYTATKDKADRILAAFQTLTGANTVRMPINPYSVGEYNAWWSSYIGAIDAALARGMKVILGYWEADNAKDGLIDNVTAWNRMWQTVVNKYAGQDVVYFEPMNEPYGYSLDQWVQICANWIATYGAQVPRGRVVVSGTGYNQDVTGVGAAPELQGTLLSLHFYAYWHSVATQAEWTAYLEASIGPYAARTIIDEAGCPMTTGLNYNNADGDQTTSYFAAITTMARSNHMGLVYWPGLRGDDIYAMLALDGGTGGMTGLRVNNPSGLARLRWGWNAD